MGIRLDQAAAARLSESAGRASVQGAPRQPTHSPQAAPQVAPGGPEPAGSASAPPAAASLQAAIGEINQNLQDLQTSLDIVHDDASGRSAVIVRDSNGKVIRQLPPQAVLNAFAQVRRIVGVLLDETG